MIVSVSNFLTLLPEYYLAAAKVLGSPGAYQYGTHMAGDQPQPLLLIIEEATAASGEADQQILSGKAQIQLFRMEKHTERVGGNLVETEVGVTDWHPVSYGITPVIEGTEVKEYTLIVVAKSRIIKHFTDAVTAIMGNPSTRISDYPGPDKGAEV